MELRKVESCTAFAGVHCVAKGELGGVAARVKEYLDAHGQESVLIFDDNSSELVEIDFRGTPSDVLTRLQARIGGEKGEGDDGAADENRKRPGRPKLGVVAREVTLLPRHWEWLNSQSGGASVALRRLVEEARKANYHRDGIRQAQEAAYRFMAAMAGDMPGFEEATRALFAYEADRFARLIDGWPEDIQNHVTKLASSVFKEQ